MSFLMRVFVFAVTTYATETSLDNLLNSKSIAVSIAVLDSGKFLVYHKKYEQTVTKLENIEKVE